MLLGVGCFICNAAFSHHHQKFKHSVRSEAGAFQA